MGSHRTDSHRFIAASLLACGLALFVHSARGADVVRCEGANGQVIYGNAACPPGTRVVRKIQPPKQPSPDDQQAAQARIKRDTKEVERIEQERAQEEAKAERQRVAAAEKANTKARECAKLERNVRYAQEDLEKAAPNKKAAAERKLKRAQETLEGSCR